MTDELEQPYLDHLKRRTGVEQCNISLEDQQAINVVLNLVSRLRAQLADLERERQAQDMQHRAIYAALGTLSAEKLAQSETIARLAGELAEAQTECVQLRMECTAANAKRYRLEAQLSAQHTDSARLDSEIVQQTNELARTFYHMMGYVVRDDYQFHSATHPQEQLVWCMAVKAQDVLTSTDVENAIAEAEEPPAMAGPKGDA